MMSDWTFFSNYGHVLVCLARNSGVRLRDVAVEVGITERAVQKIVRDLQEAGYLTVTKQGRCNRYRINKRKSLRHSLESHCTVGKLLALIAGPAGAAIASTPDVASEAPAGDQPAPVTRDKAAKTEPEPAADAAWESEKEIEKEKKQSPVDKRQQGSLF